LAKAVLPRRLEDPGKSADAATRKEYEDALKNYDRGHTAIAAILNRIYNDMRNLGILGTDRALNYAATNIFELGQNSPPLQRIRDDSLELDTINVLKSMTCAPGSECYDVQFSFFSPQNIQLSTTVFRYTIDVSDVVPFRVGDVVYWSRR